MPKARQSSLGKLWGWALEFLEEIPFENAATRPVIRRVRRAAQFLYLVGRGCVENRFPMRAAALSFTTLLALVPLLAVGLSVSRSVLRERSAEVVPKFLDHVVEMVAPQLQYMPVGPNAMGPVVPGQVVVSAKARQQAVDQIQAFLANIDTGALGTVGMIFLTVVAIRLLMTIERTFNDIWGVARGRSIWRKIVYYWASVTLGPVLLLGAMVLTGAGEFSHFVERLALAPWLSKLFVYGTPFVLLWIGFSAMYGLMPNTQVRPWAAVVGGVIGGSLWQGNNLLSALYFSRVVTYSKIYGGLGIVPVFLVGLYFSWLIVLFGAQVSFAAQNIRSYLQQRASERVDQAGRERIACRAVLAACRAFLKNEPPPGSQEIADQIGAPVQLLNQLTERLTDGGVLRVVSDREPGLIPARLPESITVADVLRVVRTARGAGNGKEDRRPNDPVSDVLAALDKLVAQAPANENFRDLAAELDGSKA